MALQAGRASQGASVEVGLAFVALIAALYEPVGLVVVLLGTRLGVVWASVRTRLDAVVIVFLLYVHFVDLIFVFFELLAARGDQRVGDAALALRRAACGSESAVLGGRLVTRQPERRTHTGARQREREREDGLPRPQRRRDASASVGTKVLRAV